MSKNNIFGASDSKYLRTGSNGMINLMDSETRCNDFIMFLGHNDISGTLNDEGKAFNIPTLCCVTSLPGSLEITTDPGGIYAVFGDRKNGVISSSLRRVLSQGGRKYQINGDALCEQLVTGAVTGRETCFHGLERIDGCGVFELGGTRVTCRRFNTDTGEPPRRFYDARTCMDFQLEVLRMLFKKIAVQAGAHGVSMGLSGGYDSRLMFLLALEAKIPIHPFTFVSSNHAKEYEIADKLAAQAGISLHKVAVSPMSDLDDIALKTNINDAITYYDGRTNESMGTFGDCHTARIQRECIGSAALNLNGLGGELFRNRERLPFYSFSFKDWLSLYVIGPANGGIFISESAFHSFADRLACKYGELLGIGKLMQFDKYLARRWYREIWLPYFAGARLSAENRVGVSLMPFADGRVSAAAFAATPFIGSYGEFESAMLQSIDKKIAAMPSSYGAGFGPSPMSRRLSDFTVSLIPLKARIARHKMLMYTCRTRAILPEKWQGLFGEPIHFLKTMNLPLNIDLLLQDQVLRDRTLFIAEFLYRHRQYII